MVAGTAVFIVHVDTRVGQEPLVDNPIAIVVLPVTDLEGAGPIACISRFYDWGRTGTPSDQGK